MIFNTRYITACSPWKFNTHPIPSLEVAGKLQNNMMILDYYKLQSIRNLFHRKMSPGRQNGVMISRRHVMLVMVCFRNASWSRNNNRRADLWDFMAFFGLPPAVWIHYTVTNPSHASPATPFAMVVTKHRKIGTNTAVERKAQVQLLMLSRPQLW